MKYDINGERLIRIYLEHHKYEYYQEKWFSDCRDINPLPFDFYLEKYNTCIEFDGKLHFEDNHFFNTSFHKIQLHDKIKNDYCKTNNINLIRIPYWDISKIDTILDNYFSHDDIV